MKLTCESCSSLLTIPDESLPKDVDSVMGQCPKCGHNIHIRIKTVGVAGAEPAMAATGGLPRAEQTLPAEPPAATRSPESAPASAQVAEAINSASAASPAPAAASAQAPSPEPARTPAPVVRVPPNASLDNGEKNGSQSAAHAPRQPTGSFDDVSGKQAIMVCFDDAAKRTSVRSALEDQRCAVIVPENPEEAIARLESSRFDVLILHREFGGGVDKNTLLKKLKMMSMAHRRNLCVGLIAKELATMDPMAAFAESVHFVVAESDLSQIKSIAAQALADNDQFYRVYREAAREAGKA